MITRTAMLNGFPRQQRQRARSDSTMNYFSSLLLPVVLAMYLAVGYIEGLAYWSFWLLISLLVTELARRLLSTPLALVRFSVLSYLVLTIMGLTLVLIYRSLYGADFAPWSDDSYYYRIICRIAEGQHEPSATFYEYIMSVWYLLVKTGKAEPVLLDLLPMNWATGAMVMVLSYALSYEVTKIRCPLFLLCVTLFGNSTLTNTVVNLYRDGMVILFSLVAMLAIVRSKLLIALAGTVLAAGIRGANGMLLAVFIAYAWASKSAIVARNWILTTILLGIIGGAGMFLDYEFGLGSRLRRITGITSAYQEGRTLIEAASQRASFRSIRGERAHDMTTLFANRVPGGFLAMPILTMFSPMRFTDMTQERMKCSFVAPSGNKKRIYASGIYPIAPGNNLTVLSWIVVVPYLVLGIIAAFRGSSEERKFTVFFFLALLSITYVSMLERHRLIFIVLYPVFIALGSRAALNQRTALLVLRITTIMVIIVANIATLIIFR